MEKNFMGRGVKGKYKAENFKGEATELANLENAAMMAGEDTSIVETNPPNTCLLYTSPSPRDGLLSRMPSSA